MNNCVLDNLSDIYRKTADKFLFIGQHNSVILVFVMLYVSLVVLFFGHSFATGDDVGILNTIYNGYETSYMSVILGRFISVFYRLCPTVPWYGIFLYFVHIISLFLFVKCLLKVKNIKYWIPPLLLLYLLFYSELLVRVSFNNSGIMLGTMSILAFLFSSKKTKNTTWFTVILGFLLSFSFLIRVGAVVAAFGCTLFLFVSAMLRKELKSQSVAIFLFPLILMILSHVIVLRYDVSGNFKTYHQFDSLRHKFHNFPIEKLNWGNKELLAANNWTEKDYSILVSGPYVNEKKYNVQTMKNIFKYSVPGLPFSAFLKRFPKGLVILYKNYRGYLFYFVFLGLIVASMMDFLALLNMIFFLLFIISGAIYLWIFLRFPFSISKPIFLSTMGVSVFFTHFFNIRKNYRMRSILMLKAIAIALFLFVFISSGLQLYGFYRFVKKKIQLGNTGFAKLNNRYPNTVIFLAPGASENMCKYVDSLSSTMLLYSRFKVIPFGWLTFSPLFYKVIKNELGAEYGYEILPRFIDNERAFLITSEDILSNVFSYLLVDSNRPALRFERVCSLTKKTNIYRLVSKLHPVKF